MRPKKSTKYISGHGYITLVQHGEGINDIFSSIWKAGKQILTKLPSKLIDAGKDAVVNIASKSVKAIGEKVGDKIADKITSKKPVPVSPSQQATPELRRQVLQELSLIPDNPATQSGINSEMYKQFYGSGNSKKRLKGRGVRLL